MIRVLIADDQALVRSGFRAILGAQPDIEVVGEVGTGITGTQPARVVMLTTFDLDEHVHDAFRAGATAFLLKTVAPEYLIEAVRAAHAGEALLAPAITRRLVERFAGAPRPGSSGLIQQLTEREREVLRLIAEGMSNDEIASRLFVSTGTVKTHVGRILAKCGLRDRVQAVVLAYETGLVHPGERRQ